MGCSFLENGDLVSKRAFFLVTFLFVLSVERQRGRARADDPGGLRRR